METENMSAKSVVVRRRISVPAQAAWEIIRTGAEVDRWVPVITSCRLEGTGSGAKRLCTVNGQEVTESIATVDDPSRLFQYRIDRQSLMPIRNALGTVHVTAAGPTEAEVLWIMNFEVIDENAWPAVKQGMEEIYRAAIEGLERHAKKIAA